MGMLYYKHDKRKSKENQLKELVKVMRHNWCHVSDGMQALQAELNHMNPFEPRYQRLAGYSKGLGHVADLEEILGIDADINRPSPEHRGIIKNCKHCGKAGGNCKDAMCLDRVPE